MVAEMILSEKVLYLRARAKAVFSNSGDEIKVP